MNSDLSDDISVLSAGTNSMSISSVPLSLTANIGLRPRLSPVSEADHAVLQPRSDLLSIDKNHEMLTPVISTSDNDEPAHKISRGGLPALRGPSKQLAPDDLFIHKKVLPIKSQQSALSRMLNGGKSSNPFTETYASVSGRSAPASTVVSVYFPHAKRPAGKPMDLTISRDATVEEVIGFALWTYWEEGWLPKLDEGLSGPSDPRWDDKVSACGWILRLAEDDGEVDDDFPRVFFSATRCCFIIERIFHLAPDRLGKIIKFNADAYVVLAASPAQSTLITLVWMAVSLTCISQFNWTVSMKLRSNDRPKPSRNSPKTSLSLWMQ